MAAMPDTKPSDRQTATPAELCSPARLASHRILRDHSSPCLPSPNLAGHHYSPLSAHRSLHLIPQLHSCALHLHRRTPSHHSPKLLNPPKLAPSLPKVTEWVTPADHSLAPPSLPETKTSPSIAVGWSFSVEGYPYLCPFSSRASLQCDQITSFVQRWWEGRW
jgi:hypothetical protein